MWKYLSFLFLFFFCLLWNFNNLYLFFILSLQHTNTQSAHSNFQKLFFKFLHSFNFFIIFYFIFRAFDLFFEFFLSLNKLFSFCYNKIYFGMHKIDTTQFSHAFSFLKLGHHEEYHYHFFCRNVSSRCSMTFRFSPNFRTKKLLLFFSSIILKFWFLFSQIYFIFLLFCSEAFILILFIWVNPF